MTFVVGSVGGVAFADDTPHASAASAHGAPTVINLTIKGRHAVPVSVDVGRMIQRAPLPDLRKSLVDPWGNVLDKDPF
jgi:hypothetical protein